MASSFRCSDEKFWFGWCLVFWGTSPFWLKPAFRSSGLTNVCKIWFLILSEQNSFWRNFQHEAVCGMKKKKSLPWSSLGMNLTLRGFCLMFFLSSVKGASFGWFRFQKPASPRGASLLIGLDELWHQTQDQRSTVLPNPLVPEAPNTIGKSHV